MKSVLFCSYGGETGFPDPCDPYCYRFDMLFHCTLLIYLFRYFVRCVKSTLILITWLFRFHTFGML